MYLITLDLTCAQDTIQPDLIFNYVDIKFSKHARFVWIYEQNIKRDFEKNIFKGTVMGFGWENRKNETAAKRSTIDFVSCNLKDMYIHTMLIRLGNDSSIHIAINKHIFYILLNTSYLYFEKFRLSLMCEVFYYFHNVLLLKVNPSRIFAWSIFVIPIWELLF